MVLFTLLAFAAIFDGKTLDGWVQLNGKANYKVENGVIVGATAEGSPNSFLCTKKTYGDFILEFDVLTDPALNSGVQIRSHQYERDTEVLIENNGLRKRQQPAGRVHGYQVEISNSKSGNSGGVFDEGRRGWLAAPAAGSACSQGFKDNQWNHYKIEAIADRIRTWVNGAECVDFRDPLDQTGFIGLQVHSFQGDKSAQVRWRNLEIQELGVSAWKLLATEWNKVGGGDWQQVDGAWKGTMKPEITERGFLVSGKSYSDFTIRLKYKVLRGNSGFFFRMGDLNSTEPNRMGYEVEVDPTRDAGGLQEPGAQARKWLVHPDPERVKLFYKPDDWNEMVVSAHKNRIFVHVNGRKMSEASNDPGRPEGRFALQLNPKQNLEVFFKDFELLTR